MVQNLILQGTAKNLGSNFILPAYFPSIDDAKSPAIINNPDRTYFEDNIKPCCSRLRFLQCHLRRSMFRTELR